MYLNCISRHHHILLCEANGMSFSGNPAGCKMVSTGSTQILRRKPMGNIKYLHHGSKANWADEAVKGGLQQQICVYSLRVVASSVDICFQIPALFPSSLSPSSSLYSFLSHSNSISSCNSHSCPPFLAF